MAIPILNNGLASLSNNRLAQEQYKEGGARGRHGAEDVATNGQDEAVTVSDAAQALNAGLRDQPNAKVLSIEHAATIAQSLQEMVSENRGLALAAQASKMSPELVQSLLDQ